MLQHRSVAVGLVADVISNSILKGLSLSNSSSGSTACSGSLWPAEPRRGLDRGLPGGLFGIVPGGLGRHLLTSRLVIHKHGRHDRLRAYVRGPSLWASAEVTSAPTCIGRGDVAQLGASWVKSRSAPGQFISAHLRAARKISFLCHLLQFCPGLCCGSSRTTGLAQAAFWIGLSGHHTVNGTIDALRRIAAAPGIPGLDVLGPDQVEEIIHRTL